MQDWVYRSVWVLLLVVYIALPLQHLDDYAWDYDEGPVLQAAALLQQGYALYEDIVFNKPPLLVWLLHSAFVVGDTSVMTARVMMLIVNTLGFIALGILATQWWGKWAGPLTLGLFLMLPEVPVRTTVVMNDLPAMTAALLTFVALTAFRRSRRWPWFIGGAITYSAMIALHPLLVFLTIPLGLILVYDPREILLVTPRHWKIGLGFGALTVGLTLLWLLPLPWDDFATWVLHYNSSLEWQQNAGQQLWNYLSPWWSLIGLALLGTLSLSQIPRHRFGVAITLLWLYLTYAFLLLHRPLWAHYPLFIMYPLVLLAAGGIVTIGQQHTPAIPWVRPLWRSALVIGLSCFVYQRSQQPLQWHPWSAAQIADREKLHVAVPTSSFVISDDQFLAFAAGYRVPPTMADTSFKRIFTDYLHFGELAHAWLTYNPPVIILASGRFDKLPHMQPGLRCLTYEPTCYTTFCMYPSRPYQTIESTLGNSVRLRGYRITPETPLRAGEALTVTLFWESLHAQQPVMSVFVHLTDKIGTMLAQHDGVPLLGTYPTETWRGNEVIPDPHVIILPATLSSAEYDIAVGMYQWPSLERLPALDAHGELWPDGRIILPALTH